MYSLLRESGKLESVRRCIKIGQHPLKCFSMIWSKGTERLLKRAWLLPHRDSHVFNTMPPWPEIIPHFGASVVPGDLLQVVWETGVGDRKSPSLPSYARIVTLGTFLDLFKFQSPRISNVMRSPKPRRVTGSSILYLAKDLTPISISWGFLLLF